MLPRHLINPTPRNPTQELPNQAPPPVINPTRRLLKDTVSHNNMLPLLAKGVILPCPTHSTLLPMVLPQIVLWALPEGTMHPVT